MASLPEIAATAAASGNKTIDLQRCNLTCINENDVAVLAPFEQINAANNPLEALPDNFASLDSLKTLFFLGCKFKTVPAPVGRLRALRMLSFKSQFDGGLVEVHESALPEQLVWLILTENALRSLPPSLGRLAHLRKLMLASNQLSQLPDLSGCVSLELVRLSDNQLGKDALAPQAIRGLLQLPKLAWIALAGNCWGPFGRQPGDSDPSSPSFALPADRRVSVEPPRLTVGPLLGSGASGNVHEAKEDGSGQAVALKLFRGSSSDGRAVDEARLCLFLGETTRLHPHIVHADGWGITEAGALATVLPLFIGIRPLAKPPNFDTVTRDVYAEGPGSCFPPLYILHVLTRVASAMAHLHEQGVCHGDLYGHNVLVDGPESYTVDAVLPLATSGIAASQGPRVLLSDLGASFAYDRSIYGQAFEKLEIRAFGCLAEEMCERAVTANAANVFAAGLVPALWSVSQRCQAADPTTRLTFQEIVEELQGLGSGL